jgi:hypothetical protein
MMTTKKPAAKKPLISASVKENRAVYEVEVPDLDSMWPDTYQFSVFPDGEVLINDDRFSTTKVAATALRQMADFLDKYKVK